MRKLLALAPVLTLALLLPPALDGCDLPAARPDVPAAAVSPVASPGESPDLAACRAARAIDTAGATSREYAALAVVVSHAQDPDLRAAGEGLARAAADGIGARSSFYAAYLNVMAQCLRFPEPGTSPSS